MYKADPRFGMARGEQVEPNGQETIKLTRNTRLGRVGPAIFVSEEPNEVNLALSPFILFGVLVEEPIA